MSNPFIDIVRTANKNKWCTTPYCTTCIAREYRQALQDLGGGGLGGGLANALSKLKPSELTLEDNWQDALLTAIIDLPFSLQLEGILKNWSEKLDEDINFTDFVLFKVIRNISSNSEIWKQWIDICISLAVRSHNFSLIESLLLVMGRKAVDQQELIEIAKEYAKSSRQMKRVLSNSCGIK
ncbi:MAG TPA: hypothetical protein DEQ20_04780 [Desulfobulbaceae bacterium]|nr:MAG: hypothetical protein A2520_01615 [Deltaproteobacteria bacterium RIFOXYD12_FULL_53_23]HCC54227.1 hypothetical protein [Desulfobulbaceae bacterium]